MSGRGVSRRDAVLVFDQNQTTARITLPFQFRNVRAVYLREIFVLNANFRVGRLKFNIDSMEHEACNAVGQGFVFVNNADGGNVGHTVYTEPRLISDRFKEQITDCSATLTSVTNTVTLDQSPQFDQMVCILILEMADEVYAPALHNFQIMQDPRTAKGQYSTRAPWVKK